MTLVDEDLNMTPTRDLKKQQPRLYEAILKKAKGQPEEMGSKSSKVEDLDEFRQRREESFPEEKAKEPEENVDLTESDHDEVVEVKGPESKETEKKLEENKKGEESEKVAESERVTEPEDTDEKSPVIKRQKRTKEEIKEELSDKKAVIDQEVENFGPQPGENKEIEEEAETVEKVNEATAPMGVKRGSSENNNREEPPVKKVRANDEMEMVNGSDEDSDDAPEEVKISTMEEAPLATSERKKRRKNKKVKVEESEIEAPLDPSIFEAMEADETVSQIQAQNVETERKLEERKKRIFEMPDEPGVHFVKQKRIKQMTKKSTSAVDFRAAMLNRHNRQPVAERKRHSEKLKFMKKSKNK